MEKNPDSAEEIPTPRSGLGTWTAIGTGIGVAIGVFTGQLATGIAIGIVFGLGLGILIGKGVMTTRSEKI